MIFALVPSANAANLKEVQAKIEALQEDAAMAAEGAQAAKVELGKLNKTLKTVQEKAATQQGNVSDLQKSLSTIAIAQYKSGGLSQSLELLFSSDPTLFLTSAGSLEAITRKKSIQLRKFTAATQRLTATTLIVNDKLALVKATQARLTAQMKAAQSKLAQAEELLAKLEKADRERILAAQQASEDADQKTSLQDAVTANNISGRAGIALRFALKQIGDRYVFGAAGPVRWDCSGLTMRAFQASGVSLPHSSRAQANYGKSIARNKLLPGDLVFFGKPISHVGIYLGGGKMVHAPRPGARVKVISFGNSLGSKRYVGARRL
jgi:cell wall-associated NlpC family hydrolase